MSLEDLVKASQRMTEKDFPQFDDPRVREVMAAAANVVEGTKNGFILKMLVEDLKTALFAAQHSKPRTCEGGPPFGVGCTKCLRDGPENCWNHRMGKP